MAESKVLSIQSHVVHGHVGNTAAVFPLQLLGYQVDVINSVQLSNHTGYKCCPGKAFDSGHLKELISGLRNNSLLNHSHLLTGYVGDPSFLNEVYEVAVELKKLNPKLIYLCDPVLGDNGELYVPSELVPIYRDKFIKIADILTPNSYEAELLTDITIKTETDAEKALDELFKRGAKTVIITSVDIGNDTLVLVAGQSNVDEIISIHYPKITGDFTGTGDIFAAVLLGWFNHGLKVACQKTLSTLQCVLTRTLKHALELSGGKTPTVEQIELQLIQSKRDIESPPDNFISNGGLH